MELTLVVAPARASTDPAAAPGRSLTMTVSGSYGAAEALPATAKNRATALPAHRRLNMEIPPPAGGRRGILSLEANLAVPPRPVGRELGVLESLHGRLEQLGEPLQTAALGAQ